MRFFSVRLQFYICFTKLFIVLRYDVREKRTVFNVKIIMDRFSGKSKGFGFIEMPDNSEADQAIKALNGKFIEGKNIKVNQADPGGKRSRKSFRKRRY